MDEKLKQQIIQELGLSTMAPAEQNQAIERVGILIFQSILVRVMDSLSEPDRSELERLLTTGTPDSDAVLAFLTSKVPDLAEIVADEVKRFKEDASAVMSQ